jgi:hypothetical protein
MVLHGGHVDICIHVLRPTSKVAGQSMVACAAGAVKATAGASHRAAQCWLRLAPDSE